MPSTIFNGFPPLHSLEPGAAVYPSRHLSQIAVVPPTEKVFSRHSSHLAAILSFLGIKIKPGLQLVQISSTQVHISLGHSAEQNATRLKTMQRSRNLFIFFNCVVWDYLSIIIFSSCSVARLVYLKWFYLKAFFFDLLVYEKKHLSISSISFKLSFFVLVKNSVENRSFCDLKESPFWVWKLISLNALFMLFIFIFVHL